MHDGIGAGSGRIRALASMSWRDRALLASAALLLMTATAVLKVLPFTRLYGFLARSGPLASMAPPSAAAVAEARAVGRIVAMASRHTPFAGACLQRSLVVWWLLRRRNLDSTIRFGAKKADGRFLAHAWVEFGGDPVEEGDRNADAQYVAMPWLPADRGL